MSLPRANIALTTAQHLTAGPALDPSPDQLLLGPGPLAAAVVLLAVVTLVAGGSGGRARLRGLNARPSPDPTPTATLRPGWVVVGTLAIGALSWAVAGAFAGVAAGAAAGAAGTFAIRRRRHPGDDSGELAARWELLAVCLEAGLPVASAVAAAAEPLTGGAGSQLRQVAGLLALGADPAEAWRAAGGVPSLITFARAAGRSAVTGAALAEVARSENTRIRADLIDTAQARAQRAGVHIAGPLGLCFLPAFLVLGIAPVVVGLAGEALARW